MDAASLVPLQRLIAIGRHSLLQYVSESSPFTTTDTREAFTQILALAEEERDAVSKLTRWLQKKHLRLIIGGSYPAHFTQLNFITIDYLVPRLIEDDARHQAEIERTLTAVTDEEVRTLIQAYLEMKRRHLHTLQDLLSKKEPVAS